MFKKRAFSLAEVLIVLSIFAVFAAITAPIYTQKLSDKAEGSPHGLYACFWTGFYINDPPHSDYSPKYLYEYVEYDGQEHYYGPARGADGKCQFEPVKGAEFYLVKLGGAGGGGALRTGIVSDPTTPFACNACGEVGEVVYLYLPTISDSTDIEIGIGGMHEYDGNDAQDGTPSKFGSYVARAGTAGADGVLKERLSSLAEELTVHDKLSSKVTTTRTFSKVTDGGTGNKTSGNTPGGDGILVILW